MLKSYIFLKLSKPTPEAVTSYVFPKCFLIKKPTKLSQISQLSSHHTTLNTLHVSLEAPNLQHLLSGFPAFPFLTHRFHLLLIVHIVSFVHEQQRPWTPLTSRNKGYLQWKHMWTGPFPVFFVYFAGPPKQPIQSQ